MAVNYRKLLKNLPIESDAVWQAGWVELKLTHPQTGEQLRARLSVWGNVGLDDDTSVSDPAPDSEWSLDLVLEQMLVHTDAATGMGYLPGRIEVEDAELVAVLQPHFEGLDVAIVQKQGLELLEDMRRAVAVSAEMATGAGSLDSADVSESQLRGFAAAAAAFYEAGLWYALEDSDVITVESPAPAEGMAVCVVLGAGGQTFGLALYPSLEAYQNLRTIWSHEDLSEKAEALDGWLLDFGTAESTHPGTLALWQHHKLPTADGEVYPAILHINPSHSQTVTAEQLAYLEGLLRALEVSESEQFDAGHWMVEVETGAGANTFKFRLDNAADLLDQVQQPSPDVLYRRAEYQQLPVFRYLERQGIEPDDLAGVKAGIEKLNADISVLATMKPASPREEAEDLVAQAFEATGRKQLKLIDKALELWPDCADAYLLMGRRSSDYTVAIAAFTDAIKAGERAIGEDFDLIKGDFWDAIITRPYMRARFDLATALNEVGRTDEAIEHFEALLELNPNDNQGAREVLLSIYLELAMIEQARKLFEAYPLDIENTALFAYGHAIHMYQVHGDCKKATTALTAARKVNGHLAEAILAGDALPDSYEDGYQRGGSSEAAYAHDQLLPAISETPGLYEWLVEKLSAAKRTKARRSVANRRRRSR